MKIKNKKDFGLGIFGIVFSIVLIIYINTGIAKSQYAGDPGPRLFPMIGACVMLLCSIIILLKPDPVKTDAEGKPKAFLTKEQWKGAGIIFLIYCIFAVLMYFIGWTYTMPIILFILTFVLSRKSRPDIPTKKRIIICLIFAAIAGVLIYLAYIVGLQASLPKGVIWKWF